MRKSGRYFTTSVFCSVCDGLKRNLPASLEEEKGGASLLAPARYPVHNWYTYVQTYSPEFVRYVIQKVGISSKDLIIDPFSGTGTTLVEAKLNGINSIGIEAIDFLAFVSKVKTGWDTDDAEILNSIHREVCERAQEAYKQKPGEYLFRDDSCKMDEANVIYRELTRRGYISAKPLVKLLALKQAILEFDCEEKVRELLKLALAATILPSSNMKFGPEIGLRRTSVDDENVFSIFQEKIVRIRDDLRKIPINSLLGQCKVCIGDAREMRSVLQGLAWFIKYEKDHIITSPPYPQDHDYTRSVRLELILLDFAKNMLDFRKLKKRMVRSCTRGIYSTDNDSLYVEKFQEIETLARKIDKRVKETGGTSGFEKLYSRLVREYFGGMYRFLIESYDILTKGGTATFLVGDSHAFKMTHIETAKLLKSLAFDVGFEKSVMETWRYIRSTAHEFLVPEKILTLYK